MIMTVIIPPRGRDHVGYAYSPPVLGIPVSNPMPMATRTPARK
jgi:hypothetical protein